MSRSSKKGPFVDPNVYKKVQAQLGGGSKEPIKTWARACTIVPEFVGLTFMVHNGKAHLKVFVTEEMVGRFLCPAVKSAAFPPLAVRQSAWSATQIK